MPFERDELEFARQSVGETFEVVAKLGDGQMGTVFRGLHKIMQRDCAIKILHPELAADSVQLKRFQNEAQILSRLRHTNIATLHTYGITNGAAYLEMEYIDGRTLKDLIDEQGKVQCSQALPWFTEICSALSYAHDEGIVHRDLKPSNVMVTSSASSAIKVVDFGIAKLSFEEGQSAKQHLTQTGHLLGSPAYMSPEQCGSGLVDRRSDVYSFGCLMYETVTGQPPFAGDNPFAVMSSHMSELPKAPQAVPQPLSLVIMKCLEKSPEMRWQSMKELAGALNSIDMEAEPIRSTRSERVSRPKAAYLTLGALALAVVAGLFYNKLVPHTETNAAVLHESHKDKVDTIHPITLKTDHPDEQIERGAKVLFDEAKKNQEAGRTRPASRFYAYAATAALKEDDVYLYLRSAFLSSHCLNTKRKHREELTNNELLWIQNELVKRNDSAFTETVSKFAESIVKDDADFSAEVLLRLANYYEHFGKDEIAIETYEKAFRRFTDLTKNRLMSFSTNYLRLLLVNNETTKTKRFLNSVDQNLKIGHFRSRPAKRAAVLYRIAETYQVLNRIPESERFLDEALAALDAASHTEQLEQGEPHRTELMMLIVARKAHVLCARKKTEQAVELLKSAEHRQGYVGTKEEIWKVMPELGNTYLIKEEFAKALECYETIRLRREAHNSMAPEKSARDPDRKPVTQANILRAEVLCYFGLKDFNKAKQCANETIRLMTPFEKATVHVPSLALDYQRLAQAETELGERLAAVEHFKKAAELYQACGKEDLKKAVLGAAAILQK